MLHAVKLIEILLVEDNVCDVELTRLFFLEAKMRNRLHVVESAEEALDFIYQRGPYRDAPSPDIIFMDLNLPHRSGREMMEIIRNDQVLHATPIIVLSGSEDEAQRDAECKAHANFYMTKPISLLSFMAAIHSVEEFWLGLMAHDDQPQAIDDFSPTQQRRAS